MNIVKLLLRYRSYIGACTNKHLVILFLICSLRSS